MAKTFDSPYQWNFNGSEGRRSFGGNFLKVWRDSRGSELILAHISITSMWSDRSANEISYFDLKTDFVVTLSQLIVSRQKMDEFVAELARWFDSSTGISKNICGDNTEQQLICSLGPPSQLETALFELQYSGIGFDNGKWGFTVDQSCVRLFIEELRAALEDLGRCA